MMLDEQGIADLSNGRLDPVVNVDLDTCFGSLSCKTEVLAEDPTMTQL